MLYIILLSLICAAALTVWVYKKVSAFFDLVDKNKRQETIEEKYREFQAKQDLKRWF